MRKKDIAIAKRLFRNSNWMKLYWKEKAYTVFGNMYQILYINNKEVTPEEVKYFDENKSNDKIIDINLSDRYKFTEDVKINIKDIDKKDGKPFSIPTKHGTIYVNNKYLFDLLDWCKTNKILYDPRAKNFTDGGSYKGFIFSRGVGRKGILLPIISE